MPFIPSALPMDLQLCFCSGGAFLQSVDPLTLNLIVPLSCGKPTYPWGYIMHWAKPQLQAFC